MISRGIVVGLDGYTKYRENQIYGPNFNTYVPGFLRVKIEKADTSRLLYFEWKPTIPGPGIFEKTVF